MIDFTTLKELTIPEGKVTKITDISGNVLWESRSDVLSLEVEKITSNTYANNTTYTGESFICFDIAPKTNGTVNVTYGGLTKTITDTSGDSEPVAQRVFFGTFNGVSDSVETPSSGTLEISGDYKEFGCTSYNTAKAATNYCSCVMKINCLGNVETLRNGAFKNCTSITDVIIPDSIKFINNSAFLGCTSLVSILIPDNIIHIDATSFSNTAYYNDDSNWKNEILYIGNHLIQAKNTLSGSLEISDNTLDIAGQAFSGCKELTAVTIPYGITNIAESTFNLCSKLSSVIIPNSVTTIEMRAFYGCASLSDINIPNSVINIIGAAFGECTSLTKVTIPDSVTNIGNTFIDCTGLKSVIIGSGVTNIQAKIFYDCNSLTSVTFRNTSGWHVTQSNTYTDGISVNVTDPSANATLFVDTYKTYYWYRV